MKNDLIKKVAELRNEKIENLKSGFYNIKTGEFKDSSNFKTFNNLLKDSNWVLVL